MKKYLLLCQYFVKKRPHSKMQTALQFFYNKFPTIMLIFHQKMLILLKLHNVLGHQSYKNVFFLSFHEKIHLSCLYFIKISLIYKTNTLLSSQYIIMKMSILSKILCFYVIFFQIQNGKPLASKPIFGQKTSILYKSLYILGP